MGKNLIENVGRRLAVLFPGIGYNFDRPLLHFAREQALQYGYEVIPVGYSGFPGKIRGNRERMAQSLEIAENQTEEILKDIVWNEYEHVIFISKSIGTIVAVEYAARHGIHADQILFTPFPETFRMLTNGRSIAFHAASDPWMDDGAVREAAKRAGAPMICYPDGNHSLETGNALQDIRILENIFERTEPFFRDSGVNAWKMPGFRFTAVI